MLRNQYFIGGATPLHARHKARRGWCPLDHFWGRAHPWPRVWRSMARLPSELQHQDGKQPVSSYLCLFAWLHFDVLLRQWPAFTPATEEEEGEGRTRERT